MADPFGASGRSRSRDGVGGDALSPGSSVRPLDAARLRRLAAALPWLRRLELLSQTSSTNDALRERAAAGAESGTVVIAEEQTAGRGRQGRRWDSPPGTGLYISVLFRTHRPVTEGPRWTVAAAVALCDSCRRRGAHEVCIKWPNDLVCGARKLAGILCELRSTARGGQELVVGAGVNVRRRAEGWPVELRGRVVCLEELAPGTVDREELAIDYLAGLGVLGNLLEEGAWQPVAGRWEALSPGSRGSRVRLVTSSGGAEVSGTTAGIGTDGALRVLRGDGTTISVHTADTVHWEN